MSDRRHLLLNLLRRPDDFRALSLEQWDLVVRQARRSGVLARIAFLLEDRGSLAEVPEGPLQHLLAARTLALKHVRDVRWEVICVTRVLADLKVPITLLKGAAYVFADLPPARGRLFADIDFMVPKDRIAAVEKALLRSEWLTDVTDAYDQRYYRQWTHQIPPLRHDRRQTVLDVHHTIVQPTARASVEPEPLVAASRTLDVAALRILAPTDMVLHSAVHLFNDGEFDRGLRDLLDLSDLLRHFGAEPGFWDALPRRAEDLGLTGPLYLTFRYLQRLLDVPIPPKALSAAERWQPSTARRALFDSLFDRALLPDHKSCDGRLTPLARWLLYARAHYLRMPFALLLPHLVRKAVHRGEEE
ncbi:nucleotidyltransferase family protein [Pelagibius sp.]|uniref:nucleotidyltransferase domain-containing protein n=1 Tax=Pelagibius sp. TaxID=1931238 RepID=UPI00261BB4D0|nr:nucleotidyltransferase family protein [Pelagibius sp.]